MATSGELERINLMLTKRCNLNCIMCDIPKKYNKDEDLKKELIFQLIDESADLGLKVLKVGAGAACRPVTVKFTENRRMI
jgi:MoaA/NifB/PqqE/SkfB family radical SAM enzyme